MGWDEKEKNSGGRQRTVGGKRANMFALYDMSGNVWEWVQDCWHDNYNGAPDDGSAWTSGKCDGRGMRGGSWGSSSTSTRAAARSSDSPGFRSDYLGFRLAKTR